MEHFVHTALMGLVGALAWTYGRGQGDHRVIGVQFGLLFVAQAIRFAITPYLDAAPLPYRGVTLFAYYLDHAIVEWFRFVILGACLRLFERASIRPAVYAYAATMVGLVILKESTQMSLIPVHAGIGAAVTAVAWVLAVRAVLAPRAKMQVPGGAHAALLLVLALMLVKVCLHYFAPVEEAWGQVRRADTFVHALIAVGYAGALVRIGVRRWRPS